jgi:tRNA(Ile)-lysidine synthase
MIRRLRNVIIPKKCTLAFSGGVDSTAVADFLLKGRHDVTLAFFHHGTQASDEAEEFVRNFASERNAHIVIGRLSVGIPRGRSIEDFWREERYKFLSTFQTPVVTAHHLDDAVETWIFSSLHGQGKLIPVERGNVVRPFLVTTKDDLKDWALRKNVPWIDDKSNDDVKYMRNLIRHKIVPEALKVNPGLRTVIKKKYLQLNQV